MSADRDNSPSLISATTILILSAFLIGTSLGGFLEEELSRRVWWSGVAGMVAFVVLEALAFRRRRRTQENEQKYVEDRLQRHVSFRVVPEPLSDHTRSVARDVPSFKAASA